MGSYSLYCAHAPFIQTSFIHTPSYIPVFRSQWVKTAVCKSGIFEMFLKYVLKNSLKF